MLSKRTQTNSGAIAALNFLQSVGMEMTITWDVTLRSSQWQGKLNGKVANDLPPRAGRSCVATARWGAMVKRHDLLSPDAKEQAPATPRLKVTAREKTI